MKKTAKIIVFFVIMTWCTL